VSSTRRVHAHVQTLKDGCVHNFWPTKTRLCVPFNILHHVCHIISNTYSRINLPHHDFFLTYYATFLTYKDVLVCKLLHESRCPYATCHIISYLNHHGSTPRLSHNFPHVQSNQHTISRLFNLRTRLPMQLFDLQGRLRVQNCQIEWGVCMQLGT